MVKQGPSATLPCGRETLPKIDRLHLIDDPSGFAVAVNGLTGAWIGGSREKIELAFQHLRTGVPGLSELPFDVLEELESGVFDQGDVPTTSFAPHLAVVHIGHVCNIDCTYCYAPKDHLAMTEQVMERVTDLLAELPHPIFVQFMGGEPLVYKKQIGRFIDLLEPKRIGLPTEYGIQTNGLMLLENGVLDFLDNNRIRFGISYDGPGAMSEARFGKRSDSLNKKMECIVDSLVSRGKRFGILTVLNRSNYKDLPRLVDWCLKKNINSLLVNPLLSKKGVKSTNSSPELSGLEAATAMQELFRYWVDNKLYKHLDVENFQAFEDNVSALARPYMCRKQKCGAGRDQLAFDTDGNIFPCDYLVGTSAFDLGNAKKITLHEIRTSTRMESLHQETEPDRLSDCRECPMFAFCGSCMASSYFNNGTLNGKRGSCQSDYATIQNIIFELLINQDYRDHVFTR